MAIMKRPAVSAGELGFDMTPMIDVVFQLIIFFMVALSFVDSQAAAKLTLPVADQAKPPEERDKELFVFNVVNLNARHPDGTLVFPPGTPPYVESGRYLNTAALRKELDDAADVSRYRSEDKKTVQSAVIIRGDRDAAWIYVMAAMKQCQEAGFIKVYLKALESEEPAPRSP